MRGDQEYSARRRTGAMAGVLAEVIAGLQDHGCAPAPSAAVPGWAPNGTALAMRALRPPVGAGAGASVRDQRGGRARKERWRELDERLANAGGALEEQSRALGERWGSAAERADTVAGAVRAPQAVSAGPRACGSHGPARYSLAVAPAACARVRRASGLCDARASWAGKDMEAAWEQNWKGLQFFITFTAVTTIFSKFLPKEPKEIVDTRRTEKEKKAKEKEARDAMSRRPDARAHARTHAPAHARARACTHTHIRAFSQACHEAAPCARTYMFRIPGFGPRV